MRNIYERHSEGFETENQFLGNGPKIDDLLIKRNMDPARLSHNVLRNAIVENYPPDLKPEMPQKKWSKDLYDLVAEKLGLDPEDPKGLSFYNCLGTNLDRRGVDCFFVFENPQNNRRGYLELDITARPNKDGHTSGSILVVNVENFPDPRKDLKSYMFELTKIAEIIAEKLLQDTGTIH